jgi:hypothetical protein
LLGIVKGRLIGAERRFRCLNSFVGRSLVLLIELREALIFHARSVETCFRLLNLHGRSNVSCSQVQEVLWREHDGNNLRLSTAIDSLKRCCPHAAGSSTRLIEIDYRFSIWTRCGLIRGLRNLFVRCLVWLLALAVNPSRTIKSERSYSRYA